MSELLTQLWARVRAQLESARSQLTNPDDEALFLYEDLLSHNELGLALDALADVAFEQRAPGEVWQMLGGAIEAMQLEPDDSVHGGAVQKVLEQLAAAHDWRGLQRLLNEWDPIGVRPDLGGPDDEYSCLYVPLVDRLHAEAPVAEIAEFLRAEPSDHFGLDPAYSRPEVFAGRLVEWYASGAPA
ncbi:MULTISPECIES: hypothetical protein [unclassified Nocardioides]|uniref:hypothetical protein n=1 Tax=unclassified Nocardioides TaxID=2615069 RepID=UPI0018D40430|nr:MULTISPECIES: hypothetical protein [unclassified Nocardioides]